MERTERQLKQMSRYITLYLSWFVFYLEWKSVRLVLLTSIYGFSPSDSFHNTTEEIEEERQNRSTEGCSKLKRSVDMTSSGKNGLNIRTNASPKWDRTRCPEE